MSALPSGTLTFLFTDIQGSTRLWEQQSEAMSQAMVRHDLHFEDAVGSHSGYVVRPRGEGDGRFAVFRGATDAVGAARQFQIVLSSETWPVKPPLAVRIALHTGEATLREGDYYGTEVNRCARIRSLAHGGQTLLSGLTAGLVRTHLPKGVSLLDLGEHELTDMQDPERIYQLVIEGLPSQFPPLNHPPRRPDERTTATGTVNVLRLLVVEDEPLFREMLMRILADEPDLEIVGVASSGADAVELALQTTPDVVLMDIEMPGEMDGIDAGLEIKKTRPETGIVLLSSHQDRRYFTSLPLEQQPGWSYLLKQSVADVTTLVRAIEGSARGLVVLDPFIVAGLRARPETGLSRLTARQRDVLKLIAQGYSNAGIAEQLSLSEHSVDNYVSTIYQELGVSHEHDSSARVKATLIALEESR